MMTSKITHQTLIDMAQLSDRLTEEYGNEILSLIAIVYGIKAVDLLGPLAISFFTMGYFEHQSAIQETTDRLFSKKEANDDN